MKKEHEHLNIEELLYIKYNIINDTGNIVLNRSNLIKNNKAENIHEKINLCNICKKNIKQFLTINKKENIKVSDYAFNRAIAKIKSESKNSVKKNKFIPVFSSFLASTFVIFLLLNNFFLAHDINYKFINNGISENSIISTNYNENTLHIYKAEKLSAEIKLLKNSEIFINKTQVNDGKITILISLYKGQIETNLYEGFSNQELVIEINDYNLIAEWPSINNAGFLSPISNPFNKNNNKISNKFNIEKTSEKDFKLNVIKGRVFLSLKKDIQSESFNKTKLIFNEGEHIQINNNNVVNNIINTEIIGAKENQLDIKDKKIIRNKNSKLKNEILKTENPQTKNINLKTKLKNAIEKLKMNKKEK
ncbi:MAG: hypothetical protein OEZ22_01610 [Spirochaetia bacterium]|nr:hypothetical protein [Spirochaetia bacterium]